MPTRPIERLLFAQGGRCFFCDDRLSPAEATVEHLVATVNGGADRDENCVACCQSLNSLFGRMSLKEKLRVVLNQRGQFKCPNGGGGKPFQLHADSKSTESHGAAKLSPLPPQKDRLAVVMSNLQKHGSTLPRTVKTLSSAINALFQKHLTDNEVANLLQELKAAGAITVSNTRVSYRLPPGGG